MRFARMAAGAVAEIIASGGQTTIDGQIIPFRYMKGWADNAATQGDELTRRNLVLITTPDPPEITAAQTRTLVRCKVGDAEAVDTWTVADRVFTADDVRAEAQRRIIVMTGARDFEHCMVKQLNALMRATELTRKEAAEGLTADEQAEAALLEGLAAGIKVLRAKSNVLEAMNPIPSDYTADSYWT